MKQLLLFLSLVLHGPVSSFAETKTGAYLEETPAIPPGFHSGPEKGGQWSAGCPVGCGGPEHQKIDFQAMAMDTIPPVLDSSGLAADSLPAIDSLLADAAMLADIRSLLDSIGIRKSFFMVDMGVSNRLFSLRNNNFNAQQPTANRIAFTPSVTYYHKSGLGFSAMAFLSSFDGKASFYQYALSPSYDYLNNKKFSFGLSYVYYLTRDDLSFYATPFRHEFYGYIRGRKGWLRPGFTAGWATGSYQEISTLDTVIFGIPRRITDTTDVGINDFSMTFSVAHHFDWDDVLVKGDGISIIPQFMLVAGAQQYDADSKTTVLSGWRLRNVTRRYNSNSAENTGLRFQSLAGSVNITYFLKKLSLSGGYFLNYYLPETDKPFTHIFSLSAGLIF